MTSQLIGCELNLMPTLGRMNQEWRKREREFEAEQVSFGFFMWCCCCCCCLNCCLKESGRVSQARVCTCTCACAISHLLATWHLLLFLSGRGKLGGAVCSTKLETNHKCFVVVSCLRLTDLGAVSGSRGPQIDLNLNLSLNRSRT